uniref:Peptidase S1 domain-containing protein n=1 Tax=Glossina pallidipes TaxID=7398 RepID=A0A1A9Z6G1_GLOPL
MNLENLFIVMICVSIGNQGRVEARKCTKNLVSFQGMTSFAGSIVLVHCKISQQMTWQIGVIISQDAILTANPAIASECYATYSDTIDGSVVEGLMEASYYREKALRYFWKLPQLKIILARHPLKIDPERLPALPKHAYQKNSTCVVVSLDLASSKYQAPKIVEKQVVLVKRNECESFLHNLHKDVLCLRAPDIFCNVNHHQEYFQGSPLLCNGILTGIVGEIIVNDINYPAQCAKIYEARQWIKSNIGLISRDNAFKTNIVAIGYLVANMTMISSLGVLLAEDKILTGNAPDLSRKNRNYALRSGEVISKGSIEYDKNQIMNWRKMESLEDISPPNRSELQITVIKLKSNIDYGRSREINKISLARRKPKKGAKCILVSVYPHWMKLEIDVLNRTDCMKELSEFDQNYLCVRPKFGGRFYENFYTGTPVICDGALIGLIVQIEYIWRSKAIPMVPVYRYKQWIQKTMQELGASESIPGQRLQGWGDITPPTTIELPGHTK